MIQEIEIRGPLTKRDIQNVKKTLKDKAELVYDGEDVAIFYKNDLRLKKGISGEKLQLKLGSNIKAERGEIEVLLKDGEFGNARKLLREIGYEDKDVSPMYRIEYKYKDVEISLRPKSKIGPHFEIEYKTDVKNIEKAKAYLYTIAKELSLKVWSEEEYDQILEKRKRNVAAETTKS